MNVFFLKEIIPAASLLSWEGEVNSRKKKKKLLQLITCYNFRTVVGKLLALQPNPGHF